MFHAVRSRSGAPARDYSAKDLRNRLPTQGHIESSSEAKDLRMSTAEIIPAEQQALTPQSKFDRLLQLAIERNAGADQFAALVDAIMKAQREDARLQFEAALGRFREHLPKVFKTKKVIIPNRDGSQTSYSHAELDKAFEIVDEELRKEGLIASWRPSEGASGRTVVTCVFRHPLSGHVEDMATLGGPPDTSGSKTPGQQIG